MKRCSRLNNQGKLSHSEEARNSPLSRPRWGCYAGRLFLGRQMVMYVLLAKGPEERRHGYKEMYRGSGITGNSSTVSQ